MGIFDWPKKKKKKKTKNQDLGNRKVNMFESPPLGYKSRT